jgi:hypothetical protein
VVKKKFCVEKANYDDDDGTAEKEEKHKAHEKKQKIEIT